MFDRNRRKIEASPPIRVLSWTPVEGCDNMARVEIDMGEDKPPHVFGVPIRPIGLGIAHGEMLDPTSIDPRPGFTPPDQLQDGEAFNYNSFHE